MSGIATGHALRKEIDVPIIYLIPNQDEDVQSPISKGDADSFLAKPVRRSELRSSLEIACYKYSVEKHLRHLNQVLRAVRDVGQLLTRETHPLHLQQGVCEILVQTRGYRFVWIGQPEGSRLKLITSAGDGEEFYKQIVSDITTEQGRKLPGTQAFHTAQPVICHDMLNDQRYAPWRDTVEQAHFRSALAVPMLLEGKVFGALSVYADRSDAFDDEEVQLLSELAGDIAFGLKTIDEHVERQRAVDALHTSQELFSLFMRHSPIYVYVKEMTPTDSRVLQASDSFQRMIGMSGRDMIGKTMSELFPATFAAQIDGDDRAVIASGKALKRDESFKGRHYTSIKFPIVQHGKTLLAGYTIDVTERKQAEADLRHASLYARNLIEASIDPLVTISPDGTIMDVNSATENVTGVARNKLVGSDFSAYFTDPEKARAGYQQVFLYGAVTNYALAIRHASGTVTDVLYNASLFRNAQGEVAGVLAAARDITERKRAEADLRIAAAVFEAQEGMVVTDARSVIQRVNRAFTEITGYSAQEALGRSMRMLKSGRHDAQFYAAMWETIVRTGSWQGELWNRRKNGEVYPQWLTITAVHEDDGAITHYVGTLTDITERRIAEDEIKHLAFYDPLTRLPNRRLLLERLRQALAAAARHGRRWGALLFIDLDNFKTLNDTLGHDKGDLLLQQVAERLAACVREGDTVARFGGDEFVVMLEDLSTDIHDASVRANIVTEKILVRLNAPFQIADQDYSGTPSIGVTLFGDERQTSDELLKQADLAMYQAKAAGRNTARFFDPSMQAALEERAAMEAELRLALREGQFVLFYQPQVDSEERMVGVEALARWQHPQRGLIGPSKFIPLAEETGLIRPLGHWVLETACHQLAAWASQPRTACLTMAVNVSARQFRHPAFVDEVLAVIDHTGADARRLKLELTESLLLDDAAEAITKMMVLKARGVAFSLDDFGTGYSSLAYLKQLPLDELKIAQSFVRDILTDPNDAAIARTILSLGKTLNLAVLAEGVETELQRDFLTREGCTAYQGYLFGRPGPTDALLPG
jgi:diguanylate cyclase (GGDEF)-like protein/PAS domain S-box-containing protein